MNPPTEVKLTYENANSLEEATRYVSEDFAEAFALTRQWEQESPSIDSVPGPVRGPVRPGATVGPDLNPKKPDSEVDSELAKHRLRLGGDCSFNKSFTGESLFSNLCFKSNLVVSPKSQSKKTVKS